MTLDESKELLKLLQVFWPIEWSQRMSRDMEERTATELAFMFKEYGFEDVRTVVRALATALDRPPAYKQILAGLNAMHGKDPTELDFRWAQYIYKVFRDSQGREYVKSCNVKIYPDGRVEAPNGIKKDFRLMRRQDIIDENGVGIYDFDAYLEKWGPVWKERRRLILFEGVSPEEAMKRVHPGTAPNLGREPDTDEDPFEGFQQVLDEVFDW